MPSSKETNFIMSHDEIATSIKIAAVGSYLESQSWRFNGVITIASIVATAVRLTDKAVFPFAKWVIKFEILPPEQVATINKPKAILGMGFIVKTKRKVMA